MQFKIFFEPLGKSGAGVVGESVLSVAQKINLGLNSVCGGAGVCHTCKIKVISGNVSDITSNEKEAFNRDELNGGWRLACQVFPNGDCKIQVPTESMTTNQRLQVEGIEKQIKVNLPFNKCNVELLLPSLHDLVADADRLLKNINNKNKVNKKIIKSIDIQILKELPPKLRSWNGKFDVLIREDEIFGIKHSDTRALGMAVDIGSTKIACYLVDLESGKTLNKRGIMNPQVIYGDDIISRVVNIIKNSETAVKMQSLVVDVLNSAIEEMCQETNSKPDDIFEVVVAGNTVMHHLFAGLPVAQLGVSPFVPAISMPYELKAREVGLHVSRGAYLYLLPNIAGFVGGDHVAVLLAVEPKKLSVPTIVLDIGTNTEISLIKDGEITSVSCASGPAFEGGHINNGMRAASGAIERVKIIGDKITYQTIDNKPPVGICGSGILDAVAEMHLAGIIDRTGRIDRSHARSREREGVVEFVLVDSNENDNGNAIVITQHDVREIQLAKAAIRTGIEVLMQAREVDNDDLGQIIIAGAFGTYIDLESAVAIGMFPPLSLSRFKQVGNAAGTGARLALISKAKRKEAEKLFSRVNYIELASWYDFMRIYLESSYFGKFIINKNKRKEINGHKSF